MRNTPEQLLSWDRQELERRRLWWNIVAITFAFGIAIGFVAGWMVAAQVMHP